MGILWQAWHAIFVGLLCGFVYLCVVRLTAAEYLETRRAELAELAHHLVEIITTPARLLLLPNITATLACCTCACIGLVLLLRLRRCCLEILPRLSRATVETSTTQLFQMTLAMVVEQHTHINYA